MVNTTAVCVYYVNVLGEETLDFYEADRVPGIPGYAERNPDTIYFYAELGEFNG